MVKVSALVLLSCIVFVGVAGAQSAPASSPTTSRSPVELVGCVSNQPGASGAFTFDESSGSKYKLTGKSVLVRGKPFPAHTAHHHAPIVMDVAEIDVRKRLRQQRASLAGGHL